MDRKEAIKLCRCGLCPTYIECEEEIAFCLSTTGKSKCIKEEKGCLCPGCPVHEKMGFRHVYYCIRGNEKDQLAKKVKLGNAACAGISIREMSLRKNVPNAVVLLKNIRN